MAQNETLYGAAGAAQGKVVFENGKLRIKYGTAPAFTDYITIDSAGLITLPTATAAASGLKLGAGPIFYTSSNTLRIDRNGVAIYRDISGGGHEFWDSDTAKAMLKVLPTAATFGLSALNGQAFNIKFLTELTTIAAAATTDTAIQIPLNAIVFYVSVYTETVIPTAATYTVIGATTATAFNRVAVGVAAGSSDVGTLNCPYANGAAQAIRITPNLTPAAATGKVRVTIFYYDVTVPTS